MLDTASSTHSDSGGFRSPHARDDADGGFGAIAQPAATHKLQTAALVLLMKFPSRRYRRDLFRAVSDSAGLIRFGSVT